MNDSRTPSPILSGEPMSLTSLTGPKFCVQGMDFHMMLTKVGKALSTSEVKALAFLCTDLIGRNLSSMESACDLFSLLENRDLLTAERQNLLAELLFAIQCPQLVRKFNLPYQTTERLISPYRKLLYDLSEDITDDDLKVVKFLLSKHLPRKKMEENVTTLELFLELERLDCLSDTDLNLLEKIIDAICPMLKNKINQFKEQNVSHSGHIAQETMGRPRSASDVPNQTPLPDSLYRIASCENFEGLQSLAQPSSMNFTNISVDFPVNFPRDEELSHQMSLLSTGVSSCASSRDRSDVSELLRSSENQTSSETEPFCPEPSHTTNTAPEELGTYPMTSETRGICLIVNNYDFSHAMKVLNNREGTDVDEKSLESVFKWLGFDVEIHKNCTRAQMLSVVKELGERNHSQVDCVVCCVLSHGLEGGVYGVDGEKVDLSELKEPFSGLECASLVEKPKLFFIQACQGPKAQMAVQIQCDGLESNCVHSDAFAFGHFIPSHADFLISKATVPQFVSFRDKAHGTWFIQSLCQNLIQLVPRRWDLLSILTHVNADVSKMTDPRGKKKQMPQPEFSLRKKVVFPVPAAAPPSLAP